MPAGLTGAILNERNRELAGFLCESANYPRVERFKQAAPHLVGSSKAIEIALPFQALEKFDPTAFEYVQETNNCVAIAGWLHSDVARAAEIAIKHEPEEWYKRTAHEPIYGYRGEAADEGMWPSLASKWLHDFGMVPREKIGSIDLSVDRTDLAISWGRRGPPDEIKKAAKLHPLMYIALCEDAEDLADGLANLYASHSGGMDSFRQERDKDGFGVPTNEGWSHDMPFMGFVRGRRPGFVCWTWGAWAQGSQPKDFRLCTGGFLVDWERVDRRIKNHGSTWLGGNAKGWPARDLTDFGFPLEVLG